MNAAMKSLNTNIRRLADMFHRPGRPVITVAAMRRAVARRTRFLDAMTQATHTRFFYSVMVSLVAAGLAAHPCSGDNSTGTNPAPVRSDVPSATQATYRLEFDNVNIRTVLHYLAALTGETILPDPQVAGTVTIINPKLLTADEARQVIVSALEVQGFTVVRVGAVTKIIPSAKGARSPIPTVKQKLEIRSPKSETNAAIREIKETTKQTEM